jgi:hypothetical protein
MGAGRICHGLAWLGVAALSAAAQPQLTPAQRAAAVQQMAAEQARLQQRREGQEEAARQIASAAMPDDTALGAHYAEVINTALTEGRSISVFVLMHDWPYAVLGRAEYGRGLLRLRCEFTNAGSFDLVVPPRQIHSLRIYDRR